MLAMSGYVKDALFVYADDQPSLIQKVEGNPYGCLIKSCSLQDALSTPGAHLQDVGHVVVAGSLADIKAIMALASEFGFSLGLIPSRSAAALKSSDIWSRLVIRPGATLKSKFSAVSDGALEGLNLRPTGARLSTRSVHG